MEDIQKEIIIQASKGDIEAYEHIYRQTSMFVYNVALRIVDRREDAQEITQDVFLKIYHNLKNFHFRSSFKTWVYRIAVNTALNLAKKRSKQEQKQVEYNDAVQFVDTKNETEGEINKKYNTKLLQSLLAILTPDQKTAIILRDIEGLKYQEIAETLKVNINTIRSRLKRAREALLAYKKKGAMSYEL